eukprot:1651546-Alexandrium_andersonii.AAC.1
MCIRDRVFGVLQESMEEGARGVQGKLNGEAEERPAAAGRREHGHEEGEPALMAGYAGAESRTPLDGAGRSRRHETSQHTALSRAD